MKLRNKKTGEIGTLTLSSNGEDLLIMKNNEMVTHSVKLSDLEEWEDYEEPVYYYFIQDDGRIGCDAVEPYNHKPKVKEHKSIGNYFKTKEEAEKAVEKLKAWKRLKDKGFKFIDHIDRDSGQGMTRYEWDGYVNGEDLDLIFGGEE